MSSLSPQLQRPYERLAVRFELWLLRWRLLQEVRRGSETSGAANDYRWTWRPAAKPFLISLRALGVVLLSTWFITAMYDLGPVMVRPLSLVVGAFLCWWAVGMLED